MAKLTSRNPNKYKSHSHENNCRQTIFEFSYYVSAFIVFLLAISFGYLHWYHVSSLHENDLFFSHLSNLERELTFRTEMGFYYSYFKQIILSPTFQDGFNSLLSDPRTEYPSCLNYTTYHCTELNALQRFNLYPELILAYIYRLLTETFQWLTQTCYKVTRDPPEGPIAFSINPNLFKNNNLKLYQTDLPLNYTFKVGSESILSCVGLGEPTYFYVTVVFCLSSLILIGLVYSGWYVARIGVSFKNSHMKFWFPIWGVILPSLAYFSNHREATRVQWTPPLRENFAYPFFTLQQAFLLSLIQPQYILNSSNGLKKLLNLTIYCLFLLGFQLPWQFAQFVLVTQVGSLVLALIFVIYISYHHNPTNWIINKSSIIGLINNIRNLLFVHLIALVLCYLLQFGNRLLLQSGYLFGLLGCLCGLYSIHKTIIQTNNSSNITDRNKWISKFMIISLWKLIIYPLILILSSTIILFISFSFLSNYWNYLFHRHNYMPNDDDGGHIWDLLIHKLYAGRKYHTFHTMLYTCAREFDFIDSISLKQPFESGLLLGAFLVTIVVLCQLFPNSEQSTKDNRIHNRSSSLCSTNSDFINQLLLHFVSLFIIIQLFCFTVMAIFIMRLKLFWTPHLCLSLAILSQSERWNKFYQSITRIYNTKSKQSNECRPKFNESPRSNWFIFIAYGFLILFTAFMMMNGIKNLKTEWSIQGTFTGYEDEVLVNWFRNLPPKPLENVHNTTSDYGINNNPWIISGPMHLMGSLRLMLPSSLPYPSTQEIQNVKLGFAFTNHPHYENAELRYRTTLAYAIYSRKSVQDVWRIYHNQLKTDFIIFESYPCPPRHGCSKPELYDLLEPEFKGNSSLCESLLTTKVKQGYTPSNFKPYFNLIYIEPSSGRLVLYVNKL